MINKILFICIAVLYLDSITKMAFANNYEDEEFEKYEEELSKNSNTINNDPFEKINRKIFAFNDYIDRNAFEPIAKFYRNFFPKPIRKSINNFVTNLTLPLSALNSFAQGKTDNALATCSNFLINTTVGIGGIFNVAEDKKIKYEKEDFGQTLGYYGIKNGPYLVIPFLGPSTLRDASGLLIEKAVDPMAFNLLEIGGSTNSISQEYRLSNSALYYVDLREGLLDPINEAKKDSFDLYATFRSVYIQQRDLKVKK